MQTKAPASKEPVAILKPIEVPSSGELWLGSECLQAADAAGAPPETGAAACRLLAQRWGPPGGDPEDILVPENSSAERLLAEALASVEAGTDKRLQKNRWWEMARTCLGIRELRRQPAPAPATKRGDLVASTMFGGAPVSKAERKSLGWYKGEQG